VKTSIYNGQISIEPLLNLEANFILIKKKMEKPKLSYTNQLARGDKEIKAELIAVIKLEFPEEKKDYYQSLENNDYKKKIKKMFTSLSIKLVFYDLKAAVR
jgi:hypothetical protein